MGVSKFRFFDNDDWKDYIKANSIANSTGCWIWIGLISSAGYGKIKVFQRNLTVHRLSFTIFKKKINTGEFVCHTCDNKACCNPDHLFIGDNSINQLDFHMKRGTLSENENNIKARKTKIVYYTDDYIKSLNYEF